jgi:hypothetical protein
MSEVRQDSATDKDQFLNYAPDRAFAAATRQVCCGVCGIVENRHESKVR